MSYTNNIIARRIPSGLGYLPTTTVRAHTVRGGLGGAESCGPTQQWDPNYAMPGLPPGQCVPKGSAMTKPSVGSSIFSSVMSLFSTPTPPAYYPAPPLPAPAGMSTNTKIAIGLGAAGLVALALIATRK